MVLSEIEKKIKALEKSAQTLEPEAETRKSYQEVFSNYAEEFYSTINLQKAYLKHSEETINAIINSSLSEKPEDLESIVRLIENSIVPPGLNTVSGTHFGYIPGGGIYTSALGDFLSAITNRYSGVFYASPGAVALETKLINWMANLLGFTGNAGGFLSSGGSMANLTAVYSAREHANLVSSDIPKTVVYLSEQTHHCVKKALKICGLKECIKRYVPLNKQFQMIDTELKKMVLSDKNEGLKPWMLVASGGTTDLGIIDPLEKLGHVADEFNIWFHVDAAYGGFFMLTEQGREKLKGISLADSVVLDPHKGLFLPYGSGALIVKNLNTLIKSNAYSASYMQDIEDNHMDLYSPAEVSPELSKHSRGFRMWLPLKIHGVEAFRSALNEKLLLTQYLWNWLKSIPSMLVSHKPELTTILFRWEPNLSNLIKSVSSHDELNKQIRDMLVDRGNIFLSTTHIRNHYWLRLTILSVRTHLKEIRVFQRELSVLIEEFSN